MRDYLNHGGKVCVVVDIPEVHYIYANVGDRESIDRCFAQLPESIDKFFGFAGVSGEHNTAQESIEISSLSYKHMMQEHLAHRMHAGGAIVNITSVGGNLWYLPSNLEELDPLVLASDWVAAEKVLDVICEDLPAGQAYTFSKRAQTYITMKFALDMLEKEFRVNAVKPGNGLTGLTAQFMERCLKLNPGKMILDNSEFEWE